MNRHDALELVLDLLDHIGRTMRDDGDAGQVLLVLGLGDREAFDIVAASEEKANDPGKSARLFVYQHGKRAHFDARGILGDQVGGTGLLKVSVHYTLSIKP